jgi:hypothetical protein
MNRKKLFTFISFIFILVAVVLIGGYFYLTSTEVVIEEAPLESTGSLADTEVDPTIINGSETGSLPTSGPIPKMRHLTLAPVAGYDFVATTSGFVIWYVDRGTGHISQTATSTLEVTRITNTTIPKVYEAHIGTGGANVVLRTLNESSGTIQTFIGTPRNRPVTSTSTDNTKELVGVFTSDTISLLGMAPTKDKFFGMTGAVSGSGNVYTFTARSTNVFSHPLKKWVPQWVNASTILLTSAPSAKTQNISYFLNPITKGFTKVLGPKNGLVTSASPDASHILFSENKGNALVFGAYNVKTGIESSLSSGTIPDKCVWSKKDPSKAYCGFPKDSLSGAFPDDWYQGKVAFNDTLRTLDANTLQFNTLTDLGEEAGTPIDALNLMLSSDEKYLLFTNKNDLTLWMLEL